MKTKSHNFIYSGIDINIIGFEDDYIFKNIKKNSIFYEADLLEEIAFFPLKKGIIIDVGANIGNHTVFFAKVLQKEVICVEPNPVTNQILTQNVGLNYLDDYVTIYEKPIGENLDDLYDSIDVSDVNLGMHKFIKTANETSKITGETIDNISKDKEVALIKIDIDGGELSALKGASRTLREYKPVLVVEASNTLEKKGLIEYLASYGYYLMTIKYATDTLLFVHQDADLEAYRSIMYAYDFTNFNRLVDKMTKRTITAQDMSIDRVLSTLKDYKNNELQNKIDFLQNKNNILENELAFYTKKSNILENKVKFLFERVKKINPIANLFLETFLSYQKKLNAKLDNYKNTNSSLGNLVSLKRKSKKKNKERNRLLELVEYALINPNASYDYIYRVLLSELTVENFLKNFVSIRHISLQLKAFNMFSNYVLDNIEDINQLLCLNEISSDICVLIIKTLNYNQKFHKMSIFERYNIVEFISYYVYNFGKNKVDNYFVECVILLFSITDKEHYNKFLNKCKLSQSDILYHDNFVSHFAVHPFLSYRISDKQYEKYLESNLEKGFSYVLSTLFIRLLNRSHYFDDIVNSFFKISLKNQIKILDRIKRLYDYFKDINLNIASLENVSIYSYVLISFFKNSSDYITIDHYNNLEKNISPEQKEILLFIKQKVFDNNALHNYINDMLSKRFLASIPCVSSSAVDLFRKIANMSIKKSNKNYSCSVIITTSNPNIEYLKLSVDSILNQTLKNVEIIIIDDCSDNSDAIQKLKQENNSIKYIRNDVNQGTYFSRNIGIKHSQGEYIFFQDDDDVSHPQRLEYSVDKLLTSNAKIFHTCVIRYSYNGLVQLDTNASVSSDGPVTMCFHKKTFEELGEFMLFRSRGDVEYRARCIKIFGTNSYASLMDVPLYYALGRDNSLSVLFESGSSFYNLEINRNIIAEAVL
jgi:FkbM family methyltransferase